MIGSSALIIMETPERYLASSAMYLAPSAVYRLLGPYNKGDPRELPCSLQQKDGHI